MFYVLPNKDDLLGEEFQDDLSSYHPVSRQKQIKVVKPLIASHVGSSVTSSLTTKVNDDLSSVQNQIKLDSSTSHDVQGDPSNNKNSSDHVISI